MKAFEFRYIEDLMIVTITVAGPNSEADFTVALDTACTKTIIQPDFLAALGYRQSEYKKNRMSVTTGTKTENAYYQQVKALSFLGHEVPDITVVSKQLPMSLYFLEGLLGVDFFQNYWKRTANRFWKPKDKSPLTVNHKKCQFKSGHTF